MVEEQNWELKGERVTPLRMKLSRQPRNHHKAHNQRTTEKIPDELQSDDTDASSKETVNSKAKKSKLVVALSPEEEQDMVEWLESNPILYNRKLSSYKETVKKEKLWSDKAVEMGKTVDVIKIWYASLRSRYEKLKKKRSGSGDMELTERDEWVVRNFEFRKRPQLV